MNRPRLLLWAAAAGLTAAASCTYDFDAPFRDTPAGTMTGTGDGGSSTGSGSGTAGAAATGGSASAGAGGVGGTGGQGTGAQAAGENCANGVDDDGDDAADCADTECQIDWECAVPAPQNWQGPAAFYFGDLAATPACGEPWDGELTAGVGIDAPDALCNPCGCDSPAVTCSDARLYYYNSTDCVSSLGTDLTDANGQCRSDTSPVNTDSLALNEGNPLNATCAPHGGGLSSSPAWSWQQEALLCTGDLLQVGCTNGNVCAPRPTTTFRRCIYRPATGYTCPSPYTEQRTVYTDGDDTRDCGSCSCGPSGNIQCSGSLEVWEAGGCTGTADHVVDTSSCTFASNLEGLVYHRFTPSYSADDCTPAGGDPTGTVTESSPYTVCCLP